MERDKISTGQEEEEEEKKKKRKNIYHNKKKKKSATNHLKMPSFCVPGAGSSLHPSLSSSPQHFPLSRPRNRIQCASIEESSGGLEESSASTGMRSFACGLIAAWAITAASPAVAASQRLPPLSTEPNRCERAFVGNTIGQANGVYDKPIDLRFCDYTNEKSNLKGKSLAAALMSDAKFDGADMSEAVVGLD